MNCTRITNAISTAFNRNDRKVRIVSAEHAGELQSSIRQWHKKRILNEKLYEEYLSHLAFDHENVSFEARSIIVIAARQPHIRISFDCAGQELSVVIPSTYSYKIDSEVKELLGKILSGSGYRFQEASLPKKLLAVRSGLAAYGRNNIAYIEGMGSYCRILAFYSDIPCEDHCWGEMRMLPRCTNCTICLKRCPTNAILADRFLIRAERCLTYLNESESAFPEWLDQDSHHCLVGCLYCQAYCPENRKLPLYIEDRTGFDREETALILEGKTGTPLPHKIRTKFEEFGFLENAALFSRNLSMLLERSGKAERMLSKIS